MKDIVINEYVANKPVTYEDFKIHANLSYKSISNYALQGKNISRSLLNGTVIEESIFTNIDLNNADLEGAKIFRSSFIECNFSSAEMHSLFITDTIFTNCRFEISMITDCIFINCEFKNCSFDNCTMSNNTYEKCIFEPIITTSMSANLNIFKDTIFKHSEFAKYFYYSIFENCIFENSTYEAYLLGFSYGLSQKDINNMNLIFMDEEKIDTDIFESLKKEYLKRGMYIHIGILYINYDRISYDEFVVMCISLFEEYIKRDLIIKSELIKFTRVIIEKMLNSSQITPSALIYAMNALHKYIKTFNNTSSGKAKNDLLSFKNYLYIEYMKFIDILQENAVEISSDYVELVLKYREKPQIDLHTILTNISQDEVELIDVRYGSYIETFMSPGNVILLFQTFLALLNVIVPFVIYKKQKNDNKVSQNTPLTTSTGLTTNNVLQNNSMHITGIKNYIIINNIEKINNILINEGILFAPHHYGYNINNIESIHVNISSDAPKVPSIRVDN